VPVALSFPAHSPDATGASGLDIVSQPGARRILDHRQLIGTSNAAFGQSFGWQAAG
jgi:hypothetical protein